MNLTAAISSSFCSAALHRNTSNIRTCTPLSFRHHHNHSSSLRVANDADRTELSSDATTETTYSDADKMVDSMNFGELCNEFECNSSPLVESTARQLARDILELRSGNRALGTYAVSVTYKDPIRSFTGREKYKRPLWAAIALDSPSATVQEMAMLSTSVLSIKWTIKGKLKSVLAGVGGDLILRITSKFTLNQISGQVIQHEELWDLSASSASARAFFWTSRILFATVESVKDLANSAKNFSANFSTKKEDMDIYPDPSGDPTKVSSVLQK
ncbi:uncharacterized protein [Cicer arietinum]|uniref:Uncharacterized protein LOC101511104 isoform X2 n=1 Tax=Cicer arietinum TaxID=3827 RepID=A0A1S2XRJ8_CICAR|nr:uncharacterized protein LOC101511104 isoform X2 [Cicer arietinum]